MAQALAYRCRVLGKLSTVLLERELDLFIDVSVPAHQSVESEILSTDRSCVIASKHHPRLRGQKSISLEQFLTEPFIKLERTRNEKAGIQWLTNAPVHDANIVAYSNSLFESMVMVSQTELISTLPVSMAEQYKSITDLQVFDLPFACKAITLYLLWHRSFNDDSGHQWLRRRFLEIYKNKV